MFKLVKVDKGECDMELYDLRVNHLWKKTGSCKNTNRRIGKF